MKLSGLVAAGLAGSAFAAVAQDRPITKVVKLLEKMMKTSAADGKKERVMFAKFKCWCDTNTESKTASIAEGEASAARLNSQIEELLGASGKLSMEVAQLKADMEANEEARDKAQSLRDKANEKFLAAEEDMEAALASMGEAINTLAAIGADQTDDKTRDTGDMDNTFGKGKGAFMAKHSSISKISKSVNAALMAASAMLSKKDQAAVSDELSFIQANLQKAAPGTYTSQSTEIIGILKNMRDTFKDNLKAAREAEASAVEAHDKFMATKKEEYDLMDSSYAKKQGELGENDTELAAKKKELKETEEQLAEDQSFLADLTAMCKEKTALYEDRKAVRAGEEAAIAQAVSVLNSDDAFDTFGKVTATAGAFVQLQSRSKQMTPRQSVMKMLLLAAKDSKSLKLAKIAVALQSGNPFATVLKSIDSMIALIDEEEQADDDKKAWCDEERKTNTESKEEFEAEVERLNGVIDQLISDIEDDYKPKLATANIALVENKKTQVEKTAERKEEAEFYAQDVKTLTEAQRLLTSALTTLKKFYDFLHAKQGKHHYEKEAGTNSKGGGLRRTHITVIASDPDYDSKVAELEELCSKEPECVGFDTQGWLKSDIGETYEAAGSDLFVKTFDQENQATLLQQPVYEGEMYEEEFKGQRDAGVLGLIEQIRDDTAKEEEEAHTAEEESVKVYDETMKDLTEEQSTLEDTIESLEASIAQAEKDLSLSKQDLKKTENALAKVVAYLAQIKPGCDFIDENLEHRKKARTAEKGALENAISLLKGTPAFKAAEHSASQDALGECKDICNEDGRDFATCEACLAGTSVPGYCAGHAGTPGC